MARLKFQSFQVIILDRSEPSVTWSSWSSPVRTDAGVMQWCLQYNRILVHWLTSVPVGCQVAYLCAAEGLCESAECWLKCAKTDNRNYYYYFLTLGRNSRGRKKLSYARCITHYVLLRAAVCSRTLPQQNGVKSLHKNRNPLKQKTNLATIFRQCRDPVTQLGQKWRSCLFHSPHYYYYYLTFIIISNKIEGLCFWTYREHSEAVFSRSLHDRWSLVVSVGDRAFPVATARVWNSLPDLVTSAPFIAVFWSWLKTRLFNISYPCDCTVPAQWL